MLIVSALVCHHINETRAYVRMTVLGWAGHYVTIDSKKDSRATVFVAIL